MMSTCAIRLCIAQLHNSDLVLNVQSRTYQVGQILFSRVQVVGVLVERNETQLKLDDGSGLLDVKLSQSESHRELKLGALIECIGTIGEPWPPSNLTTRQRFMKTMHVYEVIDHNVEVLRMLEVMYLYKYDYTIPHDSLPTQLELLSFPPGDENDGGIISSEQKGIATQQNLHGLEGGMPDTAAPSIKSWQRTSISAPGVESAVIPPVDYQLAFLERDSQLIEQGLKSLEIRLDHAPYSFIHVNDRISINGKTSTTVVAIRKYATLQSILEAENLSALLPQIFLEKGGTSNAAAAAERHYRQFFSAEEEQHNGIIVFQLAICSSGTKTTDEWSVIILRHLEAKGAIGCSIADLRFAVPSLSDAQIMDILTNLQIDALVVSKNDNYRIV